MKIIKNIFFIVSPYIYLFLIIGLISVAPFVSLVFAEEAPPATPPTAEAPQPLLLSIQYGKGGSIQEYPITSGQSVFVPSTQAANPTQNVNPQEVKETDAYRQQLGVISDQIAQKITAIQKKQAELDSEVYMVYKAPLNIELMALQSDLVVLQAKRDQITSTRTAKESLKPSQPLPPPPVVATGLNVTPTIQEGKVIIAVETQGKNKIQTSIKAGPDQWVQIFSAEKGQSQDIWAKVSSRKE